MGIKECRNNYLLFKSITEEQHFMIGQREIHLLYLLAEQTHDILRFTLSISQLTKRIIKKN